jgi:HprK-related kinase A
VKVSEISPATFAHRLKGPGLHIITGPFLFHLQTDVRAVTEGIIVLYGEFPLADNTEFADFHVALNHRRKLFPRLQPQVALRVNGLSPAAPLPLEQALALFEGTLNWCIYTYAHQYFIIHAATVERNGLAVILPAPPGSGKSTLCAALVYRGWRLLTDELTLVSTETNQIVPLPKPISLKNESLEVIAKFAPHAVFGPVSPNTVKGTIAHVCPPKSSVKRMKEPSRPAWLAFPRFRPGASTNGRAISKGNALMRVADSSVNYSLLGVKGFHILSRMIDMVDCYELEYSDLHEAVGWFDELSAKHEEIESRTVDAPSTRGT